MSCASQGPPESHSSCLGGTSEQKGVQAQAGSKGTVCVYTIRHPGAEVPAVL